MLFTQLMVKLPNFFGHFQAKYPKPHPNLENNVKRDRFSGEDLEKMLEFDRDFAVWKCVSFDTCECVPLVVVCRCELFWI